MSNRAWVTLATNDSYGLGALVLAHSLRRAASSYPAAVLITPSVTEAMRDRLRAVFADVVIVDVLDSKDAAHLALLQRPELGITFTKIHCWGLTQYEKCVFLDADTLIIQNCDELFDREELSAAPDVGWPDCFNSGVFVYKPSQETFEKLIKFAQERGSFDGGDQGLLNSFFSDWAHGDINKHLPFLYNVTSAAFYSYIPALKHYGQDMKVIHFIGAAKPWLQQFNWESRTVDAPDHLRELLQLWWDLFVGQVHSQLDESMSGVAGNLARVVPGASSQREALDELTRRQGWEAGNIDYMGADSFDNIWAKISQTLSQPRVSPPKQTSPPPKEPSPPKEPVAPVEVAQEASVVDAAASEAAAAPIALAECPAPLIPAAAEAPAQPEAEKIPVAEVPVVVEAAKVVQAPAPVEEPPAPADIPATVEAKTEVPASEIPASVEAAVAEAAAPIAEVPDVAEIPATVEACAPGEAPVPIEASASEAAASESPKEAAEKTEPTLPPTPPVTPKSTPEASTPVTESDPQVEVETQKEVVPESVAAPQPCGPVVAPQASEPVAAPPLSESVASSQPSESVDAPVPSEPVETPTTSDRVEAPKPTEPVEAPKPTEPLEAPKPTETVETSQPPTPVVAPSSDQASPAAATEQVSEATPAAATPEKPLAAPLAAATPDKSIEMSPAASDSPPLANTPSKEDAPAVPSAKSEERRKVGKLQLKPPAAVDPIPTPDSELEDAASLAHSIIASELRTPTVSSPDAAPASPPLPAQEQRLAAAEPEVPTPPVGAVSLSQIGVKAPAKSKTTTAAQIESSVADKSSDPSSPADAPKKKTVKKVVKKESGAGGEAPVPPPRKKEKKPKEK